MSDEEPKNGGTWKTVATILGAVMTAVSLIAAIFTAGMNYQRNADQQAELVDLKNTLRTDYMRRDLVEQHLMNLQQQLSRIERAIASGQ